MGTRARLFAQGLGGGAGSSPAGNAATIASILPFLTTANVSELSPNLYYSNVRSFANLQLASLNDLLDVTFYSNTGTDLRQSNYGLVWDATSNIWQPGPVTASLAGFTTDDLVEGSNNLYYTNNRSRFAIFAGDNTITYNPYTGEIRANVVQIANAGSNTTDGLPEGTQNLYFTNARVLANVQSLSIFDLRDVNDPASVFTNAILKWNGTAFVPADPADIATNLSVRANTVNTLFGFTTDDLAEGANNYYLTPVRLTNLLANLSIEAFGDVKNASSKVIGHVLTWSGTEWQAQAPGNVAGVGSASFAENANVANIALSTVLAANATFADTARLSLFTSNATYANVAGFTNFAERSNIANVALFASSTGTANSALTALFANVAGQVNSLANFTTNDLAEGNLRLYYTDAKVFSNVSQMYLDTLYNVSVSSPNVGDILSYDGTNWIAGTTAGNSLRAQFSETANVANLVVSISDHTTDELPEGANNQYYTTAKLANDIQAAIYGKDIELDDLTLFGDLTVQGNVATLNVSNIISQAKTLILGKDGGAEGVGIYVPSANASITYGGTNGGFGFDKDVTIAGNLLPAIDSRFNLGSPSKLWRGLYIGARTIYLGDGTTISAGPGGGLQVQDQYGNPAGITLANINATQFVTVDRLLGNTLPETEFAGYFGGNVLQFTSNVTGNIYFGVLKDGDFNKFAGMRVEELRDSAGVIRSDLTFYNDREAFSNSRAALKLTGNANAEFLGNVVKINNIEVIDWRGNFVGNAYVGRQDVDITKGGTGANTTQDARRNLFGDMTGGLVAKIVGSNTLAPVSILAGTGVTVTDGDAQGGSPTIAIGQPVATTDSVTFKNVSVTANLTVYGDLTTWGANNLRVSDNMIYINQGANSAANPDTGVVWGFNDGTYQHGGMFRDASDNTIKFFQGYQPEPDANIFIDTDHASFKYANIQVNRLLGNVIGTVSSLSNHTTDALAEGETNRYYTNARVVQTVTPLLTTANVVELDNLYFTNARVITALTSFLTTANVRETSANLYFTNARVLDALVTSNVQVNNLTVSGDLVVQGNTVTLNTAVLTVEDKSITLANGAINAAAADGSGIHIAGANANLTYLSTGDKFELTKNLSVLGNINLTGLFTSENFAANNITANTLSVSGNVSFGTGTGGTLTGLAYAYATNVVANLVTTDILVANIIRPTRITGNLVVDNKIFANGLVLQNIDVTDTVISGNITGGGGSTFNIVAANTITVGSLNVTSNIITLLSGVTGDSTSNASFSVNRGTNADVALRWEEEIDRWQFTNDGNAYYNIPIPAEYDNVTYSLSAETSNVTYGANLKLTGTKSNGNIIIQDQIAFKGTGLVRISKQDDDTIVVDAGIAPVTATPVASTPTEVTRFSINTYRTAEFIYTVNVVGFVNPIYANLFNSGKVLMLHDNQNVIFTQYAMLLTGTGEELVTFTANINNSNVILYATATDSNQITVRLSGTTYTEL